MLHLGDNYDDMRLGSFESIKNTLSLMVTADMTIILFNCTVAI